jgi:Ca-activated chloride channel family protein
LSIIKYISQVLTGDADFIRFENPIWLYALLVIPVFILVSWLIRKGMLKNLSAFYSIQNQKKRIPGISNWSWLIRKIIWSFALFLFILSAANFQLGSEKGEVEQEGADIIFCLDVSSSMMAEDIAPNRLDRAKHAIQQTVKSLGTDRVGIVVFAGDAYIQLPLTTDHAATKMYLDNITTDMIPVQGTSISSAIEKAIEAFPKNDAENRAIVLITDGENHDERAIQLAGEAADKNIKLYTVGIGSTEGSTIPAYRNGKKVGLKKDKAGSVVVSRINESLLIDIANEGNGAYVRSTNQSVGLEKLFDEIKGMDKEKLGVSVYRRYQSYYHYTLIIGLLFLVIHFLMIERKWGVE